MVFTVTLISKEHPREGRQSNQEVKYRTRIGIMGPIMIRFLVEGDQMGSFHQFLFQIL